jgi:hypothetical protein
MENLMLKVLTVSSLLALAATPALSQGVNPSNPVDPMVAQPNTDMAPSAQTTTDAPVDAAQATDSGATATEPRTVTVQKLVETEFSSYDVNKSGALESTEFSKWVLALYDASGDANAPKDPETKAKWAKAAFATADVDKNQNISKAELNTFLAG